MKRTLTYLITEPATIEQFLKRQGYSDGVMTALRKQWGTFQVNQVAVNIKKMLQTGDTLSITLPAEEKPSDIVAVKLPLDILYEDEDILVINKSADMPIHPSLNNYTNSLANAVLYYLFGNEAHPDFVFRCVNRLDRDTSGATIVAKHMLSAAKLSAQIRERSLHREYVAIVKGEVTPSAGTIDAPIARDGDSIITRSVNFETGERAITHYETIARNNGYSMLSLHLETGRTHQIRVHLKYLGYPIIGDYLYNPDYEKIHRQALHSKKLSFYHPITNRFMEIEAPLPYDMASIL